MGCSAKISFFCGTEIFKTRIVSSVVKRWGRPGPPKNGRTPNATNSVLCGLVNILVVLIAPQKSNYLQGFI